jgi:hypothetical protein
MRSPGTSSSGSQMAVMNLRDKVLYHQIHPAKLATDISASVVSLYLFWQHWLAWGLVVTFVPPVIASTLIMRFVDLMRYKESAAGRYLGKYMTQGAQAVRAIGAVIMAVAAWYRLVWVIVAGLVLILAAWLYGLANRRVTKT